jgi:GTPase SAR1 family protein
MTNQETFQSLKTHRENILRIKSDVTNLPIILVGNKKDLNKFRTVSFDEASNLAKKWHLIYIETSAKTRENVDKAFSEILIKIKENKMLNPTTTTSVRTDSQSLSSTINEIKNQKTYVSSNNLTKKEEEELRAHSTKKRVKKFYQNFKKKCILS